MLYYGPIPIRSVGLGSGNGSQGDDTVTLMVSGGIGIVQFLSVVPVIIVIDRIGEEVHIPNLWSLSHSVLQEGNHYYGVSRLYQCIYRVLTSFYKLEAF